MDQLNGVFRFLASDEGRLTRGIAGAGLIGTGLGVVRGAWGIIMAIVGLVPLAAGIFDVCVFAPLFGLPFQGDALRESLGVLPREKVDFMEGVEEYQLQR